MSQNTENDRSTLVQVMAWCHLATSHNLSHCWPRSMSLYGITIAQWVNNSSACRNWTLLITMHSHQQAHCWLHIWHVFIDVSLPICGFEQGFFDPMTSFKTTNKILHSISTFQGWSSSKWSWVTGLEGVLSTKSYILPLYTTVSCRSRFKLTGFIQCNLWWVEKAWGDHMKNLLRRVN